MEENISLLLSEIPKLETGNRLVLGIDGLSRSGKTTLVKKLSDILQENEIKVCVIHMDDHIVERKRRYNTGHEEWYEYFNLQWNVEWLKANLFQQLRVANLLILPFYDNESDTHKIKKILIPKTCVIIIEGVFLQRNEWQGYYDYLVYIDCPRDKRFLRESISTQANIEKFRNRYWKAEEYYLQNEVPTKQADLVLRN